ncbi:hypothetical protein FIU87_11990 [Bacillus sp. THAF10]|uniref:exonuclease domain-containing protein n=1 Tax=Bacillus sp. THAF10 TaxID=2587848 RepID=UPI0012A7AE29|nr:exonuclease domain-containing protein [Bacillus sp. THAF10]QFT89369.1 hypothetical protein FIU87_11990 [Bacillus sp. THAF10]
MKQRFVVLDLETTGNSPKKNDKIIQIGAVLIEGGEIIERLSSFINPGCTIPPFIEQLTNINQEMVNQAPSFHEIAPLVWEMLDGASLVAHNVPFDLSFLQAELVSNGYPAFKGNTYDTVELARILLPTQKRYKLSDLSSFFQLKHSSPHRADSDAEATAHIFLKLIDKINVLPKKTVSQLHTLLYSMKSDIYLLFQEDNNNSIEGDFLSYKGKILVKKTSSSQKRQTFENEENISETEVLDDQLHACIEEVKSLLESRQHGVIELSPKQNTWTAYCQGALSFALQSGKKVVISSSTAAACKTLAKSLRNKVAVHADTFAEINEAHQYLSLPRFLKLMNEQEDSYDAVLTKAQILVWLTETETGDLQELSLSSGGKLIWDSINCTLEGESEAEVNDLEFCYYKKAKAHSQSAKIVLTTHSFLAQEINERDLFLGVDHFLVDQAHAFHQHVSRFLGKEVSYLDLYFALTKFPDGMAVAEAKEELDEVFRLIRSYTLSRSNKNRPKAYYSYSVRNENNPSWFAVLESGQRLIMKLTDVVHLYQNSYSEEAYVLMNWRDTFYSLLYEENTDKHAWFDVYTKGARNSVTIYERPLGIGEFLAEKFYQQAASVVFISPAMSVDDDFSFMVEELGLTDFYPKEVQHPATNDLIDIYIPTDMPILSKDKNDQYIQTSAHQILELLNNIGGRVLVCFSSTEMLNNVYQELRSLPDTENTMIISQNNVNGSKQKVWKTAASFEEAIILVTNSFLEASPHLEEQVDTLVIMRLPFTALEDPIMVAKMQLAENQGKNSFAAVSLPIAVLRFKRMIFSFLEGKVGKNIYIFDRRIVEKRYGVSFMHAIPNYIVRKGNFYSFIANWRKKKGESS